jgi:hypothetical protein
MAHSERRTCAEQASGIRPYMPSSQSALNSATTTNSYSSYPSNPAVPRNNVSSTGNGPDSIESTVRQTTQNSLSSQYCFEGNRAQVCRTFVIKEVMARLHRRSFLRARKRQAHKTTVQIRSYQSIQVHHQPTAHRLRKATHLQFLEIL